MSRAPIRSWSENGGKEVACSAQRHAERLDLFRGGLTPGLGLLGGRGVVWRCGWRRWIWRSCVGPAVFSVLPPVSPALAGAGGGPVPLRFLTLLRTEFRAESAGLRFTEGVPWAPSKEFMGASLEPSRLTWSRP